MDYEIIKLNKELEDKLKIEFDENNDDVQEEYFEIVNKIIDGLLLLRYNKFKGSDPLSSRIKINDFVLSHFNRIKQNNKEDVLEELIEGICYFINMDYEGDKYKEIVRQIYTIYIENNRSLPPEKTNEIYKSLLNEQRDMYVSKNRKELIKRIKENIPITEKKKTLLMTMAKIKIAKTQIEFKNFEQIGATEEKIMESLKQIRFHLNNIKPFNKKESRLTEEQFDYFTHLFLTNSLDIEKILKAYPNIQKNAIKKIISKYNQIVFPYLENIEVEEKLLDYESVEFNHNHLKIVNQKSESENREKIIKRTSKEEKRVLLAHIEELQDILRLLPLVNLLPNDNFFNIQTFKSILLNYDRIKKAMIKQGTITKDSNFTELLNNFKEFLRLSIVYQQADNDTISILGEERIEKITLNNKNTSCNSYDYANTYIEMLKEEETYLPPISFKIEVEGILYKIESGNNYDLDRLLLGKEVTESCIGPESDGEEAFYRCLTTKSADVCLIKEANTDTFFARIILFRLGNALIMAPIYGVDGIISELYTEDFLTTLSNHIITKAKEKEDNLEYILAENCIYIDKKYESASSKENIEKYIPHCDISSFMKVILRNTKERNIDYKTKPQKIYKKERRKIEVKEHNYEKEIIRLRVLNKFMTGRNETQQEEVYIYQRVYIGQDFYIGLKEEGTIDSVVLPTNSERQKAEIDTCLEEILNLLDKNENDLKGTSIKKTI